MPPVWPHGRCTKRRWCHSHLSPTDTLYPAGRYGLGLVELNSAQTPRSASGVYESPIDKLIHSVSDRDELISSKRK
jgi:hypothetical protein